MKRGGVDARFISRWSALALFVALYARTAYRGADEISWPVHLIFRLDPLALLSELAAGSAPDPWTLFGAGILLVATALLGRFFCGWLCPLGTLLEAVGSWLRRLFKRKPSTYLSLPAPTAMVVFSGLVAATFAGLPLLGFFDPLSILLRSLTIAIFPALDNGVKEGFALLYHLDLPLITPVAEAFYEVGLETVLLFGRPAFMLAGLTGVTFVALLALELLAPRFWCRYLCPLGALLGIVARLSPLRRSKATECGACQKCVKRCPSGAAVMDPADPSLCIGCAVCSAGCPEDAMKLAKGAVGAKVPSRATRRALLGSVTLGLFSAAASGARGEEKERGWDFLRPPGAVEEREFNRRCIRCGACMRVCPGVALHPSLGEAGIGGIWSPRLLPRLGYCEYHCRLCGQVCPTGAIGLLEKGEKEKWVIGIALFDKNRCLPYRGVSECIVCEEHCPTAPKAITFEEKEVIGPEGTPLLVKLPRVVEDRCIGCGICENKCPLPGRSAILVSREKGKGDFSSPY